MKQKDTTGSLWALWQTCMEDPEGDARVNTDPPAARILDAELTGRARESCAAVGELGREESWSLLIQRLEPYLLTVLRHRLATHGRRHDAEEVLQDVYCRLFDNDRRALRLCRARSDGELLAYLKRVCASVAQDNERARRAQKRCGIESEATEEIASSEPSADEQLRTLELRRRLREECRAVCSAPAFSRDAWIFERAVVDGWESREICRWVDLREASVDAIVCRLRKRLAGRGLLVPSRRAARAA
ncbi:MAG: hypothetical protein AAF690_30440 [Acidobacteriota bacterium]